MKEPPATSSPFGTLRRGEFNLAQGIRHTARDVYFPEDLAIEDWTVYGRFLSAADESVDFGVLAG